MGTVDEYLASRAEPRRSQLARLFELANQTVAAHAGKAEQGESYGMAALIYRGKGLFTAQDTAKHIGVYPFSAAAVRHVVEKFGPGAHSKGALRYPGEVSEAEVYTAVDFRLYEIDRMLEQR